MPESVQDKRNYYAIDGPPPLKFCVVEENTLSSQSTVRSLASQQINHWRSTDSQNKPLPALPALSAFPASITVPDEHIVRYSQGNNNWVDLLVHWFAKSNRRAFVARGKHQPGQPGFATYYVNETCR